MNQFVPVSSTDNKPKPCKVAYAVTSTGRDFYSAMTRISVAAIRITNPNFVTVLACDEDSVTAMRAKRDPLLDEVDEVIACHTPAKEPGFRNRFVKTQLRQLVPGPFLFLDSDTLACDNLSELFSLDTDIACAPDRSRDGVEQQVGEREREMLAIMGWHHKPDIFVNGGVIYYNDTPGSNRFSVDWHRKWLSSYEKTGKYFDQPALNAAVFDSRSRIEILHRRFNAQFVGSPAIIPHASLLHFWAEHLATLRSYTGARRGDEPATEFEQLTLDLVKGAELRRSHVESLLRRDYPWRRHSWTDDLMARWVIKKDSFGFSDYLWFQGSRMRSIRYQLQHTVRLMIGQTAYYRVKRTTSPAEFFQVLKMSRDRRLSRNSNRG